MITRYAYIDPDTQELLWGPGPMPYFITLKDGTMWEITAHSVEENESQGIFVIDQVNYRDVDPRFEAALLPVFSIENGRPTETWSYEFIPAAVNNMLEGIDAYSEELRAKVSSRYAGQMAEYEEVYNEAVDVSNIPLDQEIPAGVYTFLEADINVTYSPALQRFVSNIREAAELVIQTRDTWKYFGSNLRKARLLAKKQIKEAADAASAKVVYDEFVSKTYGHYLL